MRLCQWTRTSTVAATRFLYHRPLQGAERRIMGVWRHLPMEWRHVLTLWEIGALSVGDLLREADVLKLTVADLVRQMNALEGDAVDVTPLERSFAESELAAVLKTRYLDAIVRRHEADGLSSTLADRASGAGVEILDLAENLGLVFEP